MANTNWQEIMDQQEGAEQNMSSQERMDLEVKLLASYLRGSSVIKAEIIGKIPAKSLVYIPNVWEKLLISKNEGIDTPDLMILLQDPNISEAERGIAEGQEYDSPIETIEEIEMASHRILERYYREELITSLSTPLQSLAEGKADFANTLSYISSELEKLEALSADEGQIGLGLGYDAENILNLVTSPTMGEIIPTGFQGYDERAGGFAKGEQIILACPTSSGKTTTMNQLCINMGLGMKDREYVREPKSCLYISLEMSQAEMWQRIIANMAGIEASKMRKHGQEDVPVEEQLSEEEIQRIASTLGDMSNYLAQHGHKFRFENADYGNIPAIMRLLATHPFDIVFIDYLNLMADGENLWNSMGNIARQLKLLAQKRDFICVTAAQLDEDSLKIRYSRMVKEHCDSIWLWTPSQQVADANTEVTSAFTEIFIDKGRNTGKFSFWVHFDFQYMVVNSVNPAATLGLYQSPGSETQALPAAGSAAPQLAPPQQAALAPPSTIGMGATVPDNTATEVLTAPVASVITPPTPNTVDATSAIAGSIPESIRNGSEAMSMEDDGAMATYGDDAEGKTIQPQGVVLTPPGMAPLQAPTIQSEPEVVPDDVPWEEEPEVPTPTKPEPVTLSAEEIAAADNEIEI